MPTFCLSVIHSILKIQKFRRSELTNFDSALKKFHKPNKNNYTQQKNKCAACFKVLLARTYTRAMAHGTMATHSLIILGIKRQNICGISFD